MSGLYSECALVTLAIASWEMMTPLALASFISQFCFFLGALLVLNDSQAAFAALAQVAGEVVAALYVWLTFNARCGHVRPSIDILLMRRLLSETWPIFLSLLLGTMMYNFDIIALKLMNKTAEIGVYAATYRLITVFSPFLLAIQSGIYPEFSRAWPDFSRIRRTAINLSLTSFVALGVQDYCYVLSRARCWCCSTARNSDQVRDTCRFSHGYCPFKGYVSSLDRLFLHGANSGSIH